MVDINLFMLAVLGAPGTYSPGMHFSFFSKYCVWGPYEPSKNSPKRQNSDFSAYRRLNFPDYGWSKFVHVSSSMNPEYICPGIYFSIFTSPLNVAQNTKIGISVPNLLSKFYYRYSSEGQPLVLAFSQWVEMSVFATNRSLATAMSTLLLPFISLLLLCPFLFSRL